MWGVFIGLGLIKVGIGRLFRGEGMKVKLNLLTRKLAHCNTCELVGGGMAHAKSAKFAKFFCVWVN